MEIAGVNFNVKNNDDILFQDPGPAYSFFINPEKLKTTPTISITIHLKQGEQVTAL